MTRKRSIFCNIALTSTNHASAVADHMTLTGHRPGKTGISLTFKPPDDLMCIVTLKETLLIRDLQLVGSEKLPLY